MPWALDGLEAVLRRSTSPAFPLNTLNPGAGGAPAIGYAAPAPAGGGSTATQTSKAEEKAESDDDIEFICMLSSTGAT